jgi:H+/Cl- antiporter ClcA
MKRTHKKHLSKELVFLLIGTAFALYGGAVANILHAIVYDDKFFRPFPLWVKVTYALVVFAFFFGFLYLLKRAIERLSR